MRIAALALCGFTLVVTAGPAIAAGCAFEAQGEGRVAAVIDARTFRMEDGREVRLAGIEPVYSEKAAAEPSADRTSALAGIVTGHEVTLAGEDDTPDRYGRQPPSCISITPTHWCRACCWRRATRWFPPP
jgi:hypothetical protein